MSLTRQLIEQYKIENPHFKSTTKKVAIIDTETFSITEPRVYDFGIVVADLKGNIHHKAQFAVDEALNSKKMQTAFYSNKLPEYQRRIREGTLEVDKFWNISKKVNELLNDFNVKTIGAYNLPFDDRALAFSTRQYQFLDEFIKKPHQYDKLDLWTLACRYIASTEEYWQFCIENGFISKAKNLITNAEVMYAFITNNPTYKEEHISVDDCIIEYEILNFILNKKPKPKLSKMVGDIQHMPFRLAKFDKSLLE